jgi:hypothetical protein
LSPSALAISGERLSVYSQCSASTASSCLRRTSASEGGNGAGGAGGGAALAVGDAAGCAAGGSSGAAAGLGPAEHAVQIAEVARLTRTSCFIGAPVRRKKAART